MSENKIAIDFGTSRTKVAYFDPATQRPQLMHLGMESSIPSLFNVNSDSAKVLIGDEAFHSLEENPDGSLRALKSEFDAPFILIGEKRLEPKALLKTLFSEIRERAGSEIPCFNNVPPTAVQLTFTHAAAKPDLLEEAAQAVGFKTVERVSEPEAAARAWLAARPESQSRDIIVLDCGGGTVDWCYLERTESGMFQMDSKLGQGAAQIGGEVVDDALVDLVNLKLPREVLLEKLRVLKEQYCKRSGLPVRDPDADSIKLEDSKIQKVINDKFITPVCEAFKPYFHKVKEAKKREDLAVLLVGGSANLKGLRERLEKELRCQVLKWDRAEFASVLGAITPSPTEQPMLQQDGEDGQTETVYTLTKPNVLQVADEFLTLAAGNDEKPAEFIRGWVETYRSEAFRLVVVGEIKKGKSSFINALLEDWNLLPVETEVATSTAYEVRYSEAEKCTVHFNPRMHSADATQLEEVVPREIALGDVATYGTETGNPGNKEEVESIVVELPNKFLESGVTLIDTPGLGGLVAAHADITWKQASRADAFCFVLDSVESVVSLPELAGFSKFLAVPEKLDRPHPPFFFVQTKTDAAPGVWEDFREQNLESLSAHFDIPRAELRYFPVSSRQKARAWQGVSVSSLKSQSERLKMSGFPAFEKFFREELLRGKEERSARELLQRILAATRAIDEKIAGELQLFQKTGPAELEELAQQATETERVLATWEEEKYPQLVKHFNTSADELRQETHAQLQTALDAEETGTIIEPIIAALRNEELSARELAEKSDALQQKCVAKCQEVTLSILKQHQEKLGALLERTTAELGSSLEDTFASAEISLTPHEGEGLADSTSLREKAAAVGVTASGALAGDVPGGLVINLPNNRVLGLTSIGVDVGAVVLTITLLPVTLAAMIFSGRSALQKFREGRQAAARNDVRRFLRKVVEQARTPALQHFEESSTEIEGKVREFLEMAKTETAKELANRRESIAAAQEQRTEKKQQKAAKLEATAGQVAELLQRIEQMLGTETRATSMPNKP